MASTDAQTFPVKNKACRFTFPVFTSAGALVNGTIAVTISKDAGNFGNPSAGATNATQIQTSGYYYWDASATDMNCDTLAVKCSDGTNPPTVLIVSPLTIPDLSAVPSYGAGGMSMQDALGFLIALARNKMTQTASTTTLFKDDGSTTLATSSITDNGTTLTRGELA